MPHTTWLWCQQTPSELPPSAVGGGGGLPGSTGSASGSCAATRRMSSAVRQAATSASMPSAPRMKIEGRGRSQAPLTRGSDAPAGQRRGQRPQHSAAARASGNSSSRARGAVRRPLRRGQRQADSERRPPHQQRISAPVRAVRAPLQPASRCVRQCMFTLSCRTQLLAGQEGGVRPAQPVLIAVADQADGPGCQLTAPSS